MRKYSDHDRELANRARFAKMLLIPPEPRPLDRVPGYIVHFVNNKFTVVDLLPAGYCNQHKAVFPDGHSIISGMVGIHAEIRKMVRPLMSWRNF